MVMQSQLAGNKNIMPDAWYLAVEGSKGTCCDPHPAVPLLFLPLPGGRLPQKLWSREALHQVH